MGGTVYTEVSLWQFYTMYDTNICKCNVFHQYAMHTYKRIYLFHNFCTLRCTHCNIKCCILHSVQICEYIRKTFFTANMYPFSLQNIDVILEGKSAKHKSIGPDFPSIMPFFLSPSPLLLLKIHSLRWGWHTLLWCDSSYFSRIFHVFCAANFWLRRGVPLVIGLIIFWAPLIWKSKAILISADDRMLI